MMKEALMLWEFGCARHTTGKLFKFYTDNQPETAEDAFFSASRVGRSYDFGLLKTVAQDCADYRDYFKKLQADVRNMYFNLKPAEETLAVGIPPTWWRPSSEDCARERIFFRLMDEKPHLIPFAGDVPFTFDKRCLSEDYIYNANSYSDSAVLSRVCSEFEREAEYDTSICGIFDHWLPCIGCHTADPALVFSPYISMRKLNAMPELKAFSSYIGKVLDKTPYIASVEIIPSIYVAKKDYNKHIVDDPYATAPDGAFYGSVVVSLIRKCVDDETYGWSFFYWLLKSKSSVAVKYCSDALKSLANVALAEINRSGKSGLPIGYWASKLKNPVVDECRSPVPQNTRGIVDYCAYIHLKKEIKDEYRRYKNEIFNARSEAPDAPEEAQLPKRAGTIRQLMWKSLPHTCSRCGKRIESIRDMHVDHIIPLAKGGSDTFDNMQLLHKACNLSKGAKLPAEDMATAEPEVMRRYKK